MASLLSDIWRPTGSIGRARFLFWGVLLAALKLGVDWLVLKSFGFQFSSSPWADASEFYLWQSLPAGIGPHAIQALLFVALPFIWAGVVLTMKRLRSAGLGPWWGLLFFVPVIKIFFFGVISLLKPVGQSCEAPPRIGQWVGRVSRGQTALASIVITAVAAVFFVWFGSTRLANYGWSLFFGVPFMLGFCISFVSTWNNVDSQSAIWIETGLALVLTAVLVAAIAIEGMVCLIMAAPIAAVLSALGCLLGRSLALHLKYPSRGLFCLAILVLPFSFLAESATNLPAPESKVVTRVRIQAPPESVWRNVIEFGVIPSPKEILFRAGIAYPVKAEIDGSGVGAVRRCVFSTGAFVEPIEVWEPSKMLRFSVSENPPPMEEWTPYHSIHPPHLNGFLTSHAGQFLLRPLPNGGTELEGTTWYSHRLWPGFYWTLWSDEIIHRIHLRVLRHIQRLCEEKQR